MCIILSWKLGQALRNRLRPPNQPITIKLSHGRTRAIVLTVVHVRCLNVRSSLTFSLKVQDKSVTIPRLKEGRIVCCDPAVKVRHFCLYFMELLAFHMRH